MPRFSRVKPNQSFQSSADDWNAMLAAAEAHQLSGAGAAQGVAPSKPSSTVLVRNDSGEDVPRFGALGVGGPIIDPADNEAEFLQGVTVAGVMPAADHADQFVVAIEPIADGAIGRGILDGTTIARVQFASGSETTCGAEVGETGRLLAGSGSAKILWSPGTTGDQFAVVRLAASAPEIATAKITGSGSGGDGWYNAIEQVWDATADDWSGNPSGRAWGSGDLAELYEVNGTAGIAADTLVSAVRVPSTDGSERWVFALPSGLPAPGEQYMCLQLQTIAGVPTPVWDYVRIAS